MASLRERGRRCRAAAACCAALASALLLAAAPVAARDTLAPRDLEAAFDQLDVLGGFFGAFAARETNAFAQERWRRLSLGYPGTAALLRDLLARDTLRLGDLPTGRVSAVLDRGEIVVDRDLDGRWAPALLPADSDDEAAVAARRRDLLLPALFEALARRQPPQDWPWLADHLRAIGGLGALAQDPVARPLLARFFHAKDSYLWLAMQRIGAGGPAIRRALAGRQAAAVTAVRGLAVTLAATFGREPAERLEADWKAYVASVDGFAVTRGWLLLDPALRQTRLGAARREADAVEAAAAEVVAAAPRTALAAARAKAAPSKVVAAAPQLPAAVPAVTLGSLVAGESLAEQEAGVREPAAAATEVATLQSKLDALAAAVEARAVEAERLEAALATERERRVAAERDTALRSAATSPQIAVVPAPVARDGAAVPRLFQPAPFYILAAVALLFLLALLLWRRRATEAEAEPGPLSPPLLLTAPAMEELARPLAAVAAAPAEEAAPRLARVAPEQGRPVRVNGAVPATAAAKAAMMAASARRDAARSIAAPATAEPGPEPGPEPGREADAAANPIVQALRKGNLPLFELLFAELTHLRTPQLQRIVYGGRGEDLAIVCRAVGVDKLLFGSIYLLTDHLRGGGVEEEPERTAAILRLYDRMPPATAQKVLAKWQRHWSGAARREPVADG